MNTDRIEKTIVLQAPQTRVWNALAQANAFGAWFGMTLHGEFAPGAQVQGRFPIDGSEPLIVDMLVEQVEPEHLFSYRWHPYPLDRSIDYSNEPTTLVTFRLAPEGDSTRVTITESGFDMIPLERRATAFRMNDEGWSEQITNLERYVATA